MLSKIKVVVTLAVLSLVSMYTRAVVLELDTVVNGSEDSGNDINVDINTNGNLDDDDTVDVNVS